MKPRLLDLFCKAGGAGMGYHLAGFEVVGIDIEPQPRYPFTFHEADAFEYLADHWMEFDVIHASPVCKGFTVANAIHGNEYPNQIDPIRKMFKRYDKPYVIENVPNAPLINVVKLRGAMFGLKVKRERWFETNPIIFFPPLVGIQNGRCAPRGEYDTGKYGLITVVGNNFEPEFARVAMGIDWMTREELSQAIPPAYCEWIGEQLIKFMGWEEKISMSVTEFEGKNDQSTRQAI